jgi:hypothetical protein
MHDGHRRVLVTVWFRRLDLRSSLLRGTVAGAPSRAGEFRPRRWSL